MITAPARKRFLALLVLAALALVVDTVVAKSMAETTDETNHVNYGSRILHFEPDRFQFFYDSKMPVSAINAIPRALASIFEDRYAAPRLVSWLCDIRVARLATVLGTLFLNFFVYLWTCELYGSSSALASSILVVLSPNIIAHGTLATTDLYFALGVTVSLYYFRRYLLQPTLRNACWSGLTLALAQLTKSFAILLYGVAGCFVLLPFALGSLCPTRATRLTRRSVTTYLGLALLFFMVVINVGFCFDRPFTPLGAYRFQSASFIRLQTLPVLRSFPVPLPYPFLQGLDMMKFNEQTGKSFGAVYLLGQLGKSRDPSFRGFKSYYAVALFFKEPIALQVLFVLGLVWAWKNRSLSDFFLGEALLLAAAAALLVWLSFFNRAQIGIRQILPVFAIDVIIAGAAFAGFNSMSRLRKAFLCLLVLWLGVSVASYYPHLIPYMNEWVFDRKIAYRLLADSNLDWGQNAWVVDDFLKKNPDVTENPTTPVVGRILVSANLLVGILPGATNQMFWLRSHYEPVAHVGYAHLLFDVPSGDFPPNPTHKK
jgi:4-amino-4-deoxy-L-arabinose transferase-like glycosyltransferase